MPTKIESEEELAIGSKIRGLRRKQRLTLQDLSLRTGLSVPLLSQVENGHVMTPVATLLKIARALDVGIAWFFREDESEIKVGLTRAQDRKTLHRRPHHDAGGIGYTYELLETRKSRKHMQPLFVTFSLMEKKDLVFYTHEGEECVYLLEGELEFRTPDALELLKPGDCLYFDSDVSHAFRAIGTHPAKALVMVYSGESA